MVLPLPVLLLLNLNKENGVFAFVLACSLFFPVGVCAQAILQPPPTRSCCTMQRVYQFGNREQSRIFTDFSNLYNQNNVKNYGLALLGACVIANTEIDHNFQNWYRNHVRSDSTNEISKVAKTFGEGQIFIPIMATSAVLYRFWQEWGSFPGGQCTLGKFADRTTRGYLVGAPALLMLQPILGGNRPCKGDSYWRLFRHSHGVSGHAFMGAVPFITAAHMTNEPHIKGVFYVLSIFPGWSRVNDDAHYLSQVLLGWYLAYLSVRAVSTTDERRTLPRGLTIFPVSYNSSFGMGLHYRY